MGVSMVVLNKIQFSVSEKIKNLFDWPPFETYPPAELTNDNTNNTFFTILFTFKRYSHNSYN